MIVSCESSVSSHFCENLHLEKKFFRKEILVFCTSHSCLLCRSLSSRATATEAENHVVSSLVCAWTCLNREDSSSKPASVIDRFAGKSPEQLTDNAFKNEEIKIYSAPLSPLSTVTTYCHCHHLSPFTPLFLDFRCSQLLTPAFGTLIRKNITFLTT